MERYMTVDLEAERRVLGAKVDERKEVVGKLKGVAVETHVPDIANLLPHLVATWDETALGLTAKQAHERLQAGDSPSQVLLSGPGSSPVSVWMMPGDEHRVVARRLRDILAAGWSKADPRRVCDRPPL